MKVEGANDVANWLRYRDGTSFKTCKLRGEILLLSGDELAIQKSLPPIDKL